MFCTSRRDSPGLGGEGVVPVAGFTFAQSRQLLQIQERFNDHNQEKK